MSWVENIKEIFAPVEDELLEAEYKRVLMLKRLEKKFMKV